MLGGALWVGTESESLWCLVALTGADLCLGQDEHHHRELSDPWGFG